MILHRLEMRPFFGGFLVLNHLVSGRISTIHLNVWYIGLSKWLQARFEKNMKAIFYLP